MPEILVSKLHSTLSEVLKEEEESIAQCRVLQGIVKNEPYLGLALSGGGIRSATFNLGVLQALAKLKLIHRFDYLSTVSGGGYIGSWLSAWIYREEKNNSGKGLTNVQDKLIKSTVYGDTEPSEIQYLRRFSNYLTPKLGFFSADFWTGVATHIRNTLLNLTVLIPLMLAILCIPWLLSWAGMMVHVNEYPVSRLALASGLLILIPIIITGLNLADADARRNVDTPWWICEFSIVISLFFLLLTSYSSVLVLWRTPEWMLGEHAKWKWMVFGTLSYFSIALLCSISFLIRRGLLLGQWEQWLREKWKNTQSQLIHIREQWEQKKIKQWVEDLWEKSLELIMAFLFSALFAGFIGGFMLYGIYLLINLKWFDTHQWLVPGIGTVGILMVFSLTVVLHIGLMGRKFSEAVREWMGRAGAWLFIFSIGWLAIFLIAFLAPPAITSLPYWLVSGGGLTWIGSTVAGLMFGKGEKTGKPGTNSIREFVTQIAPYIFVVGLLCLVAFGFYKILMAVLPNDVMHMIYHGGLAPKTFAFYLEQESWLLENKCLPLSLIPSLLIIYIIIWLIMSWRIDVNIFSFQGYYRNRIARCYLGASNTQRNPHPFTGFDDDDDVNISDLRLNGCGPVQRPFHIVNTALNLTQSNNLAWQERKAASFTITPLYCGYEIQIKSDEILSAYMKTQDHRHKRGGLHFATAIATSGAAASPNMGYHSSPAVAFLLTVFNVRLGWWIPNTQCITAWREGGPRFGSWYLLKELIGSTNEDSKYVYLSDGGHFDNLGIYELVRRHCPFIIICDAEADPEFKFEGLGNAIRKCRVDLRIEIEIDVSSIRPDNSKNSRHHCAMGIINYDTNNNNASKGYLLYIKSSLTGVESEDINQYAATHSDFPHESTVDQWFSESQFESYRKLGFEAAMAAFKPVGSFDSSSIKDLFNKLEQLWRPNNAAGR